MARQNFGGFGGGANMQQLMRQAQKMQQQMTEAQEKLDAMEYEASAGGGKVTAKVNGKRELVEPDHQARSGGSRRRRDAAGPGHGRRQRSPPHRAKRPARKP